jgi:hypothetical protein
MEPVAARTSGEGRSSKKLRESVTTALRHLKKFRAIEIICPM